MGKIKFYKGTKCIKRTAMGGVIILTPEGLSRYANKATGFVYYKNDKVQKHTLARNTGYGISYMAQREKFADEFKDTVDLGPNEKLLVVDGDNGAELQIYFTEVTPMSIEEIGGMYTELLMSLPRRIHKKFIGGRKMEITKPQHGSLALLG